MAAVGRTLRELRHGHADEVESSHRVLLPSTLSIIHGGTDSKHARWALRGHQLTVAHHPLMFRSSSQLTQFLRDLATFGTNQVELAHIPASVPPEYGSAALANLSRAADAVGLNVSMWWPSSLGNSALDAAARAMPRLNSVFFPGGDGGSLVWQQLASAAKLLRHSHPSASVWVSAQELSADELDAFFTALSRPNISSWLTGVVYGPHTRVPLTEFVRRVRAVRDPLFQNATSAYAVRQYPDICHSIGAQFAFPQWDRAWALTHGREVVAPMPRWMGRIIELRSNGSTPTVGVGAYSEGASDDVHKALWSAMAEDAQLSVDGVVRQYCNFFFGRYGNDVARGASDAIFQLENTFSVPILSADAEQSVMHALELLEQSYARVPASDWRMGMLLMRARQDAFIRGRSALSIAAERSAHSAIALALRNGASSTDAIHAAREALLPALGPPIPELQKLRAQAQAIALDLNKSVGMEVLMAQDTSLNFDTLDTSTSDVPFLNDSLASIAELPSELERTTALAALANWSDAGPGGIYDSYDSCSPQARLVAGEGPQSDPSFFHTPFFAGDKRVGGQRLSWSRYVQAFYDEHITLRYTGLNTARNYTWRVVYVGGMPEVAAPPGLRSQNCVPFRLVANGGTLLHDYMLPPTPTKVLEFAIPHSILTRNGTLQLTCSAAPGGGGSGRTCKIAESWLIPDSVA